MYDLEILIFYLLIGKLHIAWVLFLSKPRTEELNKIIVWC